MSLKTADVSPTSDHIADDQTAAGAPAVDAATPPQDAKPADSSVADNEGAKQPENLLAVVKDVVAKPAGTEDSPTPKEGQEAATATAEGDKPEGEAGSEDDVPFHNHPRWQEMKAKRQAAEAERDALKSDAERYQRIDGFMREANLSATEVAEALDVSAMIKASTPDSLKAALDYWEPRYHWLLEQNGRAMPEDIREKLEAGVLDEESAQELSRARAREGLNKVNNERQQQQSDEQRQTTERQTLARDAAAGVQDWEQRIRASDPDFSVKEAFIQSEVANLVQTRGVPRNKDEAVALATEAHKVVTDRLKAALPKRQAVTPTPSVSSSATQSAKPPGSLREAITGALAR